MSTGGSIIGVGLDARRFSVPADAEGNRKTGGFENEVLMNGDGTARLIKTRVPLQLDGIALTIDDDRGDAEFLQELQDRTGFFPVVLTFASGISYQGTAQITGETQISSQSTTATVSLMGPGTLTRQ
jgi:hypothetical protein